MFLLITSLLIQYLFSLQTLLATQNESSDFQETQGKMKIIKIIYIDIRKPLEKTNNMLITDHFNNFL